VGQAGIHSSVREPPAELVHVFKLRVLHGDGSRPAPG
jgi:hypothetical protein